MMLRMEVSRLNMRVRSPDLIKESGEVLNLTSSRINKKQPDELKSLWLYISSTHLLHWTQHEQPTKPKPTVALFQPHALETTSTVTNPTPNRPPIGQPMICPQGARSHPVVGVQWTRRPSLSNQEKQSGMTLQQRNWSACP